MKIQREATFDAAIEFSAVWNLITHNWAELQTAPVIPEINCLVLISHDNKVEILGAPVETSHSVRVVKLNYGALGLTQVPNLRL